VSEENFDEAFALMLQHEGGFVKHPADPGGMTNLGVTRRVWSEYIGAQADEAVMRALTPEMVKPFYRKRYWNGCRCDDLPSGIDYAVFDFAVNSGPHRAVVVLQQVLGLRADGIVGPRTIATCEMLSQPTLLYDYADAREKFLRSLPTFGDFGRGWIARVESVREQSEEMVS